MVSQSGLKLLAASLLGAAYAGGCTDRAPADLYTCHWVGCSSGFDLQTTVQLPLAVVQTSDITLCQNGVCRTGKMRVDRSSRKDGTPGAEATFAELAPMAASGPGAATILVGVMPSGDPGAQFLSVSWYWDWASTPDAGHDAFDISIEANGEVLYQTHRLVEQYEITQPNGAEPPCGGLTCGRAASFECQPVPEYLRQPDVGVVESPDTPAMCPPLPVTDADAGM